jgi:hypothetical protein
MSDESSATSSKQRPAGVPEGAWWDAGDAEWVLGERDAEGRLQGEVRYWRPDGSYMAFCEHVDGVPHGAAGRFHESGEPSQTVFYANGQLHGTRTWFSIDGPTTENTRPYGVSDKVMRSEMDYDHGSVTAVRHYSADGERLNANGTPLPKRPDGLPEDAWYDERADDWKHGHANEDGSLRGRWRVWRNDGSLKSEREHGETGALQSTREWHPDGTEALRLDFATGEGAYQRGPEDTDCTVVDLPDGAATVTFRVLPVNRETGLHWKLDQAYRTADGQALTAEGHVITRPHPDAEPVARGSWSKSYRWRQQEPTETGRIERYWHRDGTPDFTATWEGDSLVALECVQKDGTIVRERFRIEDGGPVHTDLVLERPSGRLEVVFSDAGTVEALVQGDGVRKDLSLDGVEPAAFGEWFEQHFGPLQAANVCLAIEGFDIRDAEVDELDFYVKGVQLLANHGGDYAIVVTGGDAHRGKVFVNYHDEGIYMMHEEFDDEIREHLEDEMGIDPDEADHDTIVANLPMFENDLAPSFSDLARQFRVGSSIFETDAYAEYRPVT